MYADYIDHTTLKATARKSDIIRLCEEAIDHKFYAICVNGFHVSLAKHTLANTKVKVAAVVGFPLGAVTTEIKIAEAQQCIKDGADEIDMVINVAALQDGDYTYVKNEMAEIKKAIGDKVLKVIIETCYLSDNEKIKACELALEAHADYVKTSTGFGTAGATLHDVKLMKAVIGDRAMVKASGGIRDVKTAKQYIKAGASRIGTSSGIAIVSGT